MNYSGSLADLAPSVFQMASNGFLVSLDSNRKGTGHVCLSVVLNAHWPVCPAATMELGTGSQGELAVFSAFPSIASLSHTTNS